MYHRRNCIRSTAVTTYIGKLWHIFANALVGMYIKYFLILISYMRAVDE